MATFTAAALGGMRLVIPAAVYFVLGSVPFTTHYLAANHVATPSLILWGLSVVTLVAFPSIVRS